MSYTKRTCAECGWRAPQHEMRKRVVRGEPGFGISTNPSRKNSTRFYHRRGRKRTEWLCKKCSRSSDAGWVIVIVMIIMFFLEYAPQV